MTGVKCGRCGELRDDVEFYLRRQRGGGTARQATCKYCHRLEMSAWRAARGVVPRAAKRRVVTPLSVGQCDMKHLTCGKRVALSICEQCGWEVRRCERHGGKTGARLALHVHWGNHDLGVPRNAVTVPAPSWRCRCRDEAGRVCGALLDAGLTAAHLAEAHGLRVDAQLARGWFDAA